MSDSQSIKNSEITCIPCQELLPASLSPISQKSRFSFDTCLIMYINKASILLKSAAYQHIPIDALQTETAQIALSVPVHLLLQRSSWLPLTVNSCNSRSQSAGSTKYGIQPRIFPTSS
jgi:hypothetical protein